MKHFATPEVVTEGWYVLGRAKDLPPGRVRTVEVGKREVVAYRARDGRLHALDAHCAHLGAHLGDGRVTENGIECAFHGWCWGEGGACTRAPGRARAPERRARAYATEERHGLVWAWLGGAKPAYGVPDPGAPEGWRRIILRPQVVRAHPHLVLGNGYDMGHLGPAHGFTLEGEPIVKLDPPHHMEMVTEGALPRAGAIRLAGLGGKRFWSWYATVGGSVTLVHVRDPVEFRVLFTCRPDAEGHARTQTVLFVPTLRVLPRALALLWTTTVQDIRLLRRMRFRPAFDASDEVVATYAKLVEAMPTW